MGIFDDDDDDDDIDDIIYGGVDMNHDGEIDILDVFLRQQADEEDRERRFAHYGEDDWYFEYDDSERYGLSVYDYADEDDYLDALEEARNEAIERYKLDRNRYDGEVIDEDVDEARKRVADQYGLDVDPCGDGSEFDKAYDEARKFAESYNLYPDDYYDVEDFKAAIKEARIEHEGKSYGVYLRDFESWAEFTAALAAAKKARRQKELLEAEKRAAEEQARKAKLAKLAAYEDAERQRIRNIPVYRFGAKRAFGDVVEIDWERIPEEKRKEAKSYRLAHRIVLALAIACWVIYIIGLIFLYDISVLAVLFVIVISGLLWFASLGFDGNFEICTEKYTNIKNRNGEYKYISKYRAEKLENELKAKIDKERNKI